MFLGGGIGNIEAQIACPQYAGYLTYPCVTITEGFFFYNYSGGISSQSATATVNFGGSDQKCNTTINLTGKSCNGFYSRADVLSEFCSYANPTGTVIFNKNTQTELVCIYVGGELVPCNDLITECKSPLIELAQDLIPNPNDCKLLEGPCTIESGIWRNGKVIIGSQVSNQGFKLGVKGGVTSEQLQICNGEWCDYVFDNTYDLKSLEELNTFIQKSKHLPGCPSSEKIKQDGGFFIGDETIHQQEKIEEIFLHLIELQKRVEHIDEQLSIKEIPPSIKLVQNKSINIDPGEEYPLDQNALVQITCFQIKPSTDDASGGDGVAGIMISGANTPYTISWMGAESGIRANLFCNDGIVQIPDLISGNYGLTVTDASGMAGTCNFTILHNGQASSCDVLNDPDCRKAILDMLENEAFNQSQNCIQWEGDPCSHEGNIYHLGTVEIGTNVGKVGYSLAVKGGIVTDKFRVELCESQGWCDYVFKDDYGLLPLLEVESYIKEHKHLPGSISQKEVEENGGIELKSVKLDQQKKIEEAFLHLIALNNKKDALNQKLNLLMKNK